VAIPRSHLVGRIDSGRGSFDDVIDAFKTKLRPLGLIAAGLIIAGFAFTAAQVIRPATFSTRSEFDTSFERYRNDRSYECWWPTSANQTALTNRELVSAGQRSVEIVRWTNMERQFNVGDGRLLRSVSRHFITLSGKQPRMALRLKFALRMMAVSLSTSHRVALLRRWLLYDRTTKLIHDTFRSLHGCSCLSSRVIVDRRKAKPT
jgi:hypothetical protein